MRLRVQFSVAVVVVSVVAVGNAQRPATTPESLAIEAWTAVKEKRFAAALELFTDLSTVATREPTVAYGAGLSAFMVGRNAEAVQWLERAVALAPDMVDAAILLGAVQHRQGRVKDAIATYEAALKRAPGAPELEQQLQAWRREANVEDRYAKTRSVHFSVLFEGPADELFALRTLDMLEATYARIGGALNAYPADRITVVLYTREQFRTVTQAPDWAVGAYDGRIHVATRGALDHPRELEALLVHEYTHALVAKLAGPSAPVWLNEGFASIMEGRGEDAAAILARTSTRLPMSDLHSSFAGLPPDAVPLAYAQSARAVQRIIELRGADAIVALLKDLGRGVRFQTAFQNRVAVRYEDFERMMMRE